ncbi:nucleotidyltransferase family protein [Aerococcaceae bacterium 50-4]
MQAVGVIAEWHPFHNGHAYQVKQAKKQAKADLVVGLMSGNYVQRGEPSMVSKWDRAAVALENGCDLVIELPFWYATQPADYFAEGGVTALAALGCEAISFGVEDDHFDDYNQLAKWMVDYPDEVAAADKYVASVDNRSFAEKRIAAIQYLQANYKELADLKIHFKENANTLLAFAYAKVNASLQNPLIMQPVKRIGDNHRLNALSGDRLAEVDQVYTSGSAIRHYLFSKDLKGLEEAGDLEKLVPGQMAQTLLAARREDRLVSWADLFPYLRYRLLTASSEELEGIYQMMGGMENRMVEAIKQVDNFQDFVVRVKNRNWSANRVQRTALMVALNISKKDMQAVLSPTAKQPLMLLGATEKGRAYLKTVKQNLNELASRWQLVSRVDQTSEENWPMWLKVDRMYEILKPQIENQNFNHPPIFTK